MEKDFQYIPQWKGWILCGKSLKFGIRLGSIQEKSTGLI